MKPIKVMWNGKHLRDIYPHATGWQVFKYKLGKFIRKCLLVVAIIFSIWAVFKLGGIFNPSTIITQAEVIKEVEVRAPILDRIAGCESQGSAKLPGKHWDKNGQVLMRSNTNKSVDVGKYQINTVWFAKATELGLDITLEKDNEKMALWIYKNRGTEDWYSSKKCWQ